MERKVSELGLPRVIAHRGASGTAPENTLVSIRRAAELGATWVEIDVNVTADDVPVLMHDDYLERTTSGNGPLIAAPFSAVQGLCAGSWFAEGFANEPVPTLAQALRLITELRLGLNIEIKPTPGWEEPAVWATSAVLREYWPDGRPILFSSFSERCLAAMAQVLPHVPQGYLTGAIPRDWRERLAARGCASLHVNAALLRDDDPIAEIKDAGYGVLAYTVNDEAQAGRLFDLGIDAIFTDYPERLPHLLADGITTAS